MPDFPVQKLKVGYKVNKDTLMPLFIHAVQRIDNECHNKTDAHKEFLLRG